MSAEHAVNLSPAPDVDRFEAQRQAFSRLMARFTADRDTMIAAVQQCNERIDTLAIRLAGGGVEASGDAGGETAAQGAAGLAEVRILTERFLAQQQGPLAEARTASDRALQRADEALRRVREIAEQGSSKSSDPDELRQAVDSFDERLARLEEALLAQVDPEPHGSGAPLAAEQGERLGALEESVHALADAFEALRQRERARLADDGPAAHIGDLGLRDLREQILRLDSLAAWTPKLQRLWVSLVASAVVAAFAFVYVG